jgi:hypothetical protein
MLVVIQRSLGECRGYASGTATHLDTEPSPNLEHFARRAYFASSIPRARFGGKIDH